METMYLHGFFNRDRTLDVEFNEEELAGEKPVFMVDGWNIDPVQLNIP